MDFEFKPAVIQRIKTVKATAFAKAIAEGEDADTARRSAEKVSRAYWRDRVRQAEQSRHIKARPLRRILEKEGAI